MKFRRRSQSGGKPVLDAMLGEVQVASIYEKASGGYTMTIFLPQLARQSFSSVFEDELKRIADEQVGLWLKRANLRDRRQ